MACAESLRVQAYFDGQVDPASTAGIKQHIEGCAECAALLRELERMRWNISRTARALGISRNTLYRKIHKHRIVLEH